MSGGAGGGSPAPASPAARSGLGRSVHMPDAGSDAHEHARWQSVQWLGRDGRGCSGTRRALECAGARLPSGSGAGGGPCPQKTCPGIGRMRRSNPGPDRRPTVVISALQPRVRRACGGRQARVCDCVSTEWSPCAVWRRPRALYPPRRLKTMMARRAVTAEAMAGPRWRPTLRRPWSRWSNGPSKRSSITLN